MSYPVVDAPYGLRPVNLIGGQVFSGSTRNLPIAYGYNTNMFYGDIVALNRGQIVRQAVTTAGALNWAGTITAAAGTSYSTGAGAIVGGTTGVVGVFLGCTYTSPTTGQKLFAQYWPAGTLAGDAYAIISDDPDAVYRSAVVTASGGTTVGSVAPAMVGQNLTGSDLAGNVRTGNSSNGLVYTAITQSIAGELTASAYPFRMIDIVEDTALPLGSAILSSGGGGGTLTTTANVAFAVPVGAQVSWIAPNGQVVDTGSWVATAIAANNTTSVVLSNTSLTSIPASSTLVFTQYQEALVKFNIGAHGYYTSISNL